MFGIHIQRKQISVRLALLIWIMISATLTLYVVVIIPYQTRAVLERMRAEAEDLASAISQTTATSIVSEDYSFVVDHCMRVLNGSRSILYIVLTDRRDGFSLIHTHQSWNQRPLDGIWNPVSTDDARSEILLSPLIDQKIFHHTASFSGRGKEFWWIHIGLSLDKYYLDIRSIYIRTIILAVGCIILGLFSSLIFARRLTQPIRELDASTQRVAAGDLSARVHIDTGDELASLADSFNAMTETIERSQSELRAAHDQLEMRVRERTAELAQTNEALQNEITEHKRAKDVILASLQEKEVLLKEIHHRVKNNLQVISSLLNLQSEFIHDRASLGFFADSQNRVKSMAMIHEHLYRSDDLARIDFGEYLKNLASSLFRAYAVATSAINLRVDVQKIFLDIDTAIPCGLIVNELVSNALKYAFPEGRNGTIHLTLSEESERIRMQVADDGVGLPSGFDIQNTQSLGLRLVAILSKQLHAKIETVSEHGTRFAISFQRPHNDKIRTASEQEALSRTEEGDRT